MAKDDTLYPLHPSDDGGQPAGNTYSSPWSEFAAGNKPAANDADDDFTFTEEGLKDGISVGDAKRYSPIDPKYRGEQEDNSLETPWAKYGNSNPQANTPVAPEANQSSNTRGNDDGQFSGSTYGELEDFIKGRLDYYKSLEESDEERQKREKRERRQKSLAAIGDILGAFHRGYAYQRGVQPMEIPSLSQKMQERMDKAKAERDKNSERIMNYAVTLGKLNDSKAQADYQQKTLAIRQQQQDRLAQHEETQRTIADARIKYYEAQSSKNDEQAAYWKTKAELLERGWPQEQAEQAARIEERKARAAKYSHDANAPYRTGGGSSSGGRSSGGRTSSDGTEKVTEKTDARGHTTTTRTYTQPRRQGGTSRSGKSYTNTKKLGL
ncbi:MAG: hypothetical protein PUK16_04185 [Prevotellaceae bacterium]|nr:hypothetical protein [Prevotellaceae bacterium]